MLIIQQNTATVTVPLGYNYVIQIIVGGVVPLKCEQFKPYLNLSNTGRDMQAIPSADAITATVRVDKQICSFHTFKFFEKQLCSVAKSCLVYLVFCCIFPFYKLHLSCGGFSVH